MPLRAVAPYIWIENFLYEIDLLARLTAIQTRLAKFGCCSASASVVGSSPAPGFSGTAARAMRLRFVYAARRARVGRVPSGSAASTACDFRLLRRRFRFLSARRPTLVASTQRPRGGRRPFRHGTRPSV